MLDLMENKTNLTPVLSKIMTPGNFPNNQRMSTPVPSISMLRERAPSRFTKSVIFSTDGTLVILSPSRNIEIGGWGARLPSFLLGRHFFDNTGT